MPLLELPVIWFQIIQYGLFILVAIVVSYMLYRAKKLANSCDICKGSIIKYITAEHHDTKYDIH